MLNNCKVIGKTELVRLTGISNTTLWRLEKCGDFPKKIQLSTRRVGWILAEVEAWIKNRRTH